MSHTCVQCGNSYSVTGEDLAFLEKLSPIINNIRYDLSPPKFCHDCRLQRRMAFRNESKLYSRKCDFSGEECVSLYAPESPYTVYKDSFWWNDAWNSSDYGREIDFSRSFFEQYNELLLAVPHKAMQQNGVVENSEYTTHTSASKNCYMVYSSGLCEDTYYSSWMIIARNCVDCHACINSELLYECIDSTNCYSCSHLQDCHSCQDSIFLENCRNCHHCIACKNLRSKGYHVFNQPVSKEEFKQLQEKLHKEGFHDMQQEFTAWGYTIPTLYAQLNTCENCTGNNLEHASNCQNCFGVMQGAQDLRHCQWCGLKGKDMMDCLGAGKESELIYETTAAVTSQKIGFSSNVEMSNNCFYCESIKHCKHCFGCVGLTHGAYCIFNKKYTEEEYKILVPKLIEHMKRNGEWGENFPISISPFAYNETMAQDYLPLTKEEVLQKNFKWKDESIKIPNVEKIVSADKVPATIDDVLDEVLNWAIKCEKTQKPYLITPQELLFYRKRNIALPRLHPDERHIARLKKRLPAKLWKRACAKCHSEIETPFSEKDPHIIYCKSCFLHEIYNSTDKENIAGDESHALNQKVLHGAHMSYKDFLGKARGAKTIIQNKLKN